ncbi:MAG: hypothetical protein QW290_04940 [Sulfolobales archaeon]|uniref:Uncharacterized protein n=1 Tax=Ligamenvirales sp. TaxID=2832923 RepID=A0AAU6PXE8_9VIRU
MEMCPDFPRVEVGVVETVPAARDHLFIPEVDVDDTGVSLDVNGFLHCIKVPADYQPVKFNLDRPVTDSEYSVVYPGVAKVISRIARTLYLKAPSGQRTKAVVEVLKL